MTPEEFKGIGRQIDTNRLAIAVVNVVDALDAYVHALKMAYEGNLYEAMSPDMNDHYEKCKELLRIVRTWTVWPDVLQGKGHGRREKA